MERAMSTIAGTNSELTDINLSELLAFADAIPELGVELNYALASVVLRAIEMRLLADSQFNSLVNLWDSYRGRESELIGERLQSLIGRTPPQSLIEHVRSALQVEYNRRRSSALETTESQFEAVIARYCQTRGDELRCEYCGYHFRQSDVGAKRRILLDAYDVKLATQLHPRRERDELKPIKRQESKADRQFTQLSLDHEVPEAGLGVTAPTNLRVACMFCNNGKRFYRFPLEAVSPHVAGSLLVLSPGREWNIVHQMVVVAAFRLANSTCKYSNRSARDAELTVRFKSDAFRWFVPWNLEVVAYDELVRLDPLDLGG